MTMLAEAVSEKKRLYTAEEFFEIAAQLENEGKRLELDNGEIVEMAGSSSLNSMTALLIARKIVDFIVPRNLGFITGTDSGYKLASKRARQPDVGYISKVRGVKLSPQSGFKVAPDLAVEVVSPDEDILRKAREYFESGTQRVWAVYAEDKEILVMQLETNGEIRITTYTVNDVLTGDPVLPGFSVQVRDLFPAE